MINTMFTIQTTRCDSICKLHNTSCWFLEFFTTIEYNKYKTYFILDKDFVNILIYCIIVLSYRYILHYKIYYIIKYYYCYKIHHKTLDIKNKSASRHLS